MSVPSEDSHSVLRVKVCPSGSVGVGTFGRWRSSTPAVGFVGVMNNVGESGALFRMSSVAESLSEAPNVSVTDTGAGITWIFGENRCCAQIKGACRTDDDEGLFEDPIVRDDERLVGIGTNTAAR